jgi:hypothetical protein
MSNLEFVLSLTPEQVRKFIEFLKDSDLKIGLIFEFKTKLFIQEENLNMIYVWNNNKWEKENE